jgi:hypothetical protein
MNSICDMALVYAYAAGARVVDIDTVFSVVQGREKNGIQALAKRSSETSRDALIEKAIESFGQSDHVSPAEEATNGATRSIPPISHATNGEPSTPPHERDSTSAKEIISVTWSNGEHVAASIHREPERQLPPITAIYLPEDDLYENGAPGQRRPSALHWLRRHLIAQRDH